MKTVLLAIILIISTEINAQNAILIEKGEKAQFSGTLIKNERLGKLVKAEKKALVLEDLRIHQKDLIVFHKEDAKLQRRKLSSAKFESHLRSTGYFVLGVVLSGFAFKVTQEINK